jgi:hypothetical protein
MKTIQFTYTKEDGSVSQRIVHLTKEPGTMFAGVDISEMDLNSQANYVNEMKNAEEIYKEMIAQINAEFETKHKYRNFIAARMTDIKAL